MKKLKAEGAIGLLLGLLILSIIFIMMMPTLRNIFGGAGINGSSIKQENVEQQVDKAVEDIQRMRQQTIDYNQQNSNIDY